MSLRVRFAAAAGLAVALATIALAVALYPAARAELRGNVDSALRERARAFTDAPPPRAGDQHDRNLSNKPPPVRFGDAGGAFQFVSTTGKASRPVGETAVLPVDAHTRRVAASGTGSFFTDARVDGVHLRILTVGRGPQGAVQVARPLTEVDSALRRLLGVLIGLGAAGIGLAALLGAVVARTALAPIRRFTASTEALVDDPDLSHRLDVVGKDELARLARSFNGSLAALERSVEAQRHLVADASHELRTPIASLRANIQTLEHADRLPPEDRQALRADIIEELDELTSLVADISELARGVRPSEAVDDVRLDLVTAALVERFTRRANGAVEFHAELAPTLVRGDPERIGRAVSNLLDNAAKWTAPGSAVDVSVAADGTVTVRDRGPGFAGDDLPHVFDRFYRASNARGTPGSGLGLAIVRQAAESHGGSVEAANAPDGGAVVRLRFGGAVPAPV